MKLKIIFSTVLFLILNMTYVYATQVSCEQDVDEMRSEIFKWIYIASIDGYAFTSINDPIQKDEKNCTAIGGYYKWYTCPLVWEMGNWGNTFHCSEMPIPGIQK